MKSFRKILIANRGEIALRIIRACRAMGISPVAVYSEADKNSPHVRLADEAVAIGSAPSQESYLRIERILEPARRTGAQAIHPGYGFLAENADFAAACEDAGIAFIGPPSRVIRQMGLKSAARRLASSLGIPVVPGWDENERPPIAGFPVLIKASAGGGGRGMRVVSRLEDLESSLAQARSEAEKAFGDGSLLIEKFIRRARHVEFQILGDLHGHLVHLFERDCSLQRRYQKVIEESPCPVLSAELRERMGAAAAAIGRALGYSSAGTVEFLLAPSGEFYFIEVNTRIQVEHPVTEMITGLDLIQWQIAIAEGRPLSFQQEALTTSGHAIEARLYAEDPSNRFLPSTGLLQVWNPPTAQEGLRIDAGVEEGSSISIYYDPLLAKLISHGPDRRVALRKLLTALKTLSVHGVATNQEFLIEILESPEFEEGSTHTDFLNEYPFAPRANPEQDFLFAAATALYIEKLEQGRREILPRVPPSYRNNPYRDPSISLRAGATAFLVSRRLIGDNRYAVRAQGHQADAEILSFQPGSISVAIDGISRIFTLKELGEEFFVQTSLGSRAVRRLPRYPVPETAAEREAAHSPMPGQVLRILVEEGQPVKAGDCLIVLEAMKMEQTVQTKIDGVVGAVLVKAGEVVAPGQTLVEISSPAEQKAGD